MTAAIGHRLRWFGVWILVGFWFAGLAFKWMGDALHLALIAAIALVVYQLMADDRFPQSHASDAAPEGTHALSGSNAASITEQRTD